MSFENSMKSPLFSIIMVSFNQSKFIEQAILSVLNQSLSDFELIIIDGGSDEKTQKVLSKFQDNLHVKLFIEKDKGMYHARNKGLLMAQGKYIGFLNTDDYYELDALKVVSRKFCEYEDAEILFGTMHAVDISGKFKKIRGNENKSLLERVKTYDPFPDQATFIKRSIIPYVGLYNTTYKIVSDWDFWLRSIYLGVKIYHFDYHIANFRHYPDALTFNPKFEDLRFNEKIRLYNNYNLNTNIYSSFIMKLRFRKFIVLPIKRNSLFSKFYSKLKTK